ncbi:MAG: putative glycolipid-binding domain-containing protein [Siculibacillus sp.]|nr:putative glycolipid-binding domain-containing protein [Siculibacillus sp.]
MPSTTHALRWRFGEGDDAGLEHVEVKIADTGIAAEAVVIAGAVATAHAARWRIVVDPDWTCTRSLHLTRLGGPTVALRHDGYGGWSDGEGKPRKEFAGLSDCVVAGSPFGVTQVLKRLGAKTAKTQTLDVVSVTLPDLTVARVALKLEPLEAGRRWRVTLGDVATEVTVDADGFVEARDDAVTRTHAAGAG